MFYFHWKLCAGICMNFHTFYLHGKKIDVQYRKNIYIQQIFHHLPKTTCVRNFIQNKIKNTLLCDLLTRYYEILHILP